jgi:hypothetical protein
MKRNVTGLPAGTSIRAGVYTPSATMISIGCGPAARSAGGRYSQNHQTIAD